jgi:hypothetical protein
MGLPGFCRKGRASAGAVLDAWENPLGRPLGGVQATRDGLFIARGWPKLCNIVYKDLATWVLHEEVGSSREFGIFQGI